MEKRAATRGPMSGGKAALPMDNHLRTKTGVSLSRPKGARNRPKDVPVAPPADEASAGREGDA